MIRGWFILGAAFCFLGVAFGAFGAHGLKSKVSDDLLAIWETGVRYQIYHGLALLVLAWAASRWTGAAFTAAGILFVIGILIFSGTLYAITLTGQKSLGAITPIGGLCLLAGWIAMIVGAALNR